MIYNELFWLRIFLAAMLGIVSARPFSSAHKLLIRLLAMASTAEQVFDFTDETSPAQILRSGAESAGCTPHWGTIIASAQKLWTILCASVVGSAKYLDFIQENSVARFLSRISGESRSTSGLRRGKPLRQVFYTAFVDNLVGKAQLTSIST